MNRREFVAVPAAALAGSLFAADAEMGWQRKIRRLGQRNMTEHDPVGSEMLVTRKINILRRACLGLRPNVKLQALTF